MNEHYSGEMRKVPTSKSHIAHEHVTPHENKYHRQVGVYFTASQSLRSVCWIFLLCLPRLAPTRMLPPTSTAQAATRMASTMPLTKMAPTRIVFLASLGGTRNWKLYSDSYASLKSKPRFSHFFDMQPQATLLSLPSAPYAHWLQDLSFLYPRYTLPFS
jgi:hypothetical protein